MKKTQAKAKNFKSTIKIVKGLGSAHDGTAHWWGMKLTSLALIPLSIWFVYAILGGMAGDVETVRVFFQNPFAAVLMILFILISFHHSANGMQVVYEDYIHSEFFKLLAIYITKFAFLVLAMFSLFAVLKMAFAA